MPGSSPVPGSFLDFLVPGSIWFFSDFSDFSIFSGFSGFAGVSGAVFPWCRAPGAGIWQEP